MVRPPLILAAALALSGAGLDAAEPVPAAEPGGATMALWPGGAPGADRVAVREALFERAPAGSAVHDRFVEHVTRPLLTLFEPRGGTNGITLLIVPGGSYVRVVIDKEGFESAEWFAARGFTAAVLRYRLPGDGWPAAADAPVHDAMRAIRLLRERAATKGEAASRVGVIGFSAGGHVAARLITEPALHYERRDAADDLSARPDFAALMYPVIATAGPAAHDGSVQQLLKAGVPAGRLALYSPDRNVSQNTPPTLLAHAGDDTAVLEENSRLMFAALRRAGVRSELHLFDQGGHGFGIRGAMGKTAAAWPTLVQNWAIQAPER